MSLPFKTIHNICGHPLSYSHTVALNMRRHEMHALECAINRLKLLAGFQEKRLGYV